jgi:hypothetical protein
MELSTLCLGLLDALIEFLAHAEVALSGSAPLTGSPFGGTILSIYGRGFHILRLLPHVIKVGNQSATDVVVQSDTVMSCRIPPGIRSALTVQVIPLVEVVVPSLHGKVVVLGGVDQGLKLEYVFSYDGELFKHVFVSALLPCLLPCLSLES